MADDEKREDEKAEKKPDLAQHARNLAERHGSAEAALVLLLTENRDYRAEIKSLKEQQPASGSCVLSEDEAADWRAYKELGKPENLKSVVREHGKLVSENAEFKRSSELDGIADAAGYKAPVFRRIAGDAQFVIKDETRKDSATGRDVSVRAVYVKGEDDKLVPIEKHAEAHWKDFLPSLRPDSGQQAGPRGTPNRDITRPERTQAPVDPIRAELIALGGYQRQ